MSTQPVVIEGWDSEFGGLQLDGPNSDYLKDLEQIIEENPDDFPGLHPEVTVVDRTGQVVEQNPPAPVEPAPAPVADEPEVLERDGVTVTLTKKSGKWTASVDQNDGSNPEIFHGNNKNEVLLAVAIGKGHATKKIKELNKQIKLGTPEPVTPTPAKTAAQYAGRDLTADETFQIKTLWEADPAKAIETLIQLRTGRSLEDIVTAADRGSQASEEIQLEAVAKGFVAARPTYFNVDENYEALMGYISKNKLGRVLTPQNRDEIFNLLTAGGHYTVKNLTDAYDDLEASGLLVPKPRAVAPEPPPAPPAPPEPAPVPSDPRIVSREVRQRPGLGIPRSATTTVPSPDPQPSSAEDLDSLSDADIQSLFQATRKLKLSQSRR